MVPVDVGSHYAILLVAVDDYRRIDDMSQKIQSDLEIREGKERLQAVIDSGVSRLMPVMMAAATTILRMPPLLQDAFFISMAVTIMFGLGFATVLTLIFVPVLYTVCFKIPAKAPAG